MQPAIGDVHVNTALTNVSIAYRNSDYIADLVFPQVPVNKQSDLYYVWTKDFQFRNYVEVRAPGDNYPEGALELSTTPYQAIIYHLGYPVADETRKNQDAAVDLDTEGAEWLSEQFMLNRELKLSSGIFTTGVWGTDRTLNAAEQWSNYDSPDSDPIGDVNVIKETIKKSTGTNPNVGVIGEEVFNSIRRHPQLLDMYKHTSVPRLTAAQVAESLEVDTIIVGGAIENSAAEGATFSGGFIWGKSAMFLYVPPRPGLRTPAAGYTFVWDIDGNQMPVSVSTVREASRDRDLHKAKHAFDQKVTGTDLGYFLDSVIA